VSAAPRNQDQSTREVITETKTAAPRTVTADPIVAGTAPTAVAPPAVAPAPAAIEANFDTFNEHLSPYRQWRSLDGTMVWQPSVPIGWRPYYDAGRWVDTDSGWFWQSDYPWGDVVFHYGRWSYHPVHGWLWAPGYDYAPAWVVWRHGDVHLGWAPLSWCGSSRRSLVLTAVSASTQGFEFGLAPVSFTFVSAGMQPELRYPLEGALYQGSAFGPLRSASRQEAFQ